MNIVDKTLKPTKLRKLTDKIITGISVIGVAALLIATLSQINDGKDQLNQDKIGSHKIEVRR
ncbi:hypothetical protein [Pseudomonas sp. NBRC 111121]|uniref:hypothetical protein n=1 Tax=Pseudomonas sp. NBRC 111121 TaxID=1661036 RepID=UPI000AD57F7A|nr:hypothetical protein [Pseudomonas sp. NBRC 111121]